MDTRAFRAALYAASPRLPVTISLVAANLLVALAAALAGVPILDPRPDDLLRWGANVGPLTTGGEWWRIATSVFLHIGLAHLAVNLVALADLGRTAERLFGAGPFLCIYLASGIVGAACSVAWNPWVYSAGASGAIFGILGAMVAYSLAGVDRVPREIVRLHWLTALGFVAFTAVVGALGVGGVDHAAHLGGFACGATLGRILARPLIGGRPALGAGQALLALAIVAIALAAVATTWRSVRPAFETEQHFVAEVRAFVATDAGRIEALQASFEHWRRGELTRDAHAAELARYAAELRETADRLARHRLSADSPARPLQVQTAVITVLRLRADAMDLRADAVRKEDRAAAAAADRRIAEADALWGDAVCGKEGAGLFRCPSRKPAAGRP